MRLSLHGPNGEFHELESKAGERLSEAIWLSGQIAPLPLCAGIGNCGRCRVQFLTAAPEPTPKDRATLPESEIRAGWRLACAHSVLQPATLRLPPDSCQTRMSIFPPAQDNVQLALGIDLGTTSIQWRAIRKDAQEEICAEGSLANPQAAAGADIISRLAFALKPDGLNQLATIAQNAILAIARDLQGAGYTVASICVAANSAMTEILLGMDISGLMQAPLRLSCTGNCLVNISPELPPVLIPPLPAPFVGGDISAGLLAIREKNAVPPYMLIDLGTNAELALVDATGSIYLASAPLGPALEGVGPACGQAASAGVITGFNLVPAGLEPEFADRARPERILGISATGYLALLALLLKNGLMTEQGFFAPNPKTPLARKMATILNGDRLELGPDLYLTTGDIEILLKVKAALAIAFRRTLTAASLKAEDLSAIWLAGALGEHADAEALATLGFLPYSALPRLEVCGNTSLEGACLLAANPEKCAPLAALCANAHLVKLTEAQDFDRDYLAEMNWGHNAA